MITRDDVGIEKDIDKYTTDFTDLLNFSQKEELEYKEKVIGIESLVEICKRQKHKKGMNIYELIKNFLEIEKTKIVNANLDFKGDKEDSEGSGDIPLPYFTNYSVSKVYYNRLSVLQSIVEDLEKKSTMRRIINKLATKSWLKPIYKLLPESIKERAIKEEKNIKSIKNSIKSIKNRIHQDVIHYYPIEESVNYKIINSIVENPTQKDFENVNLLLSKLNKSIDITAIEKIKIFNKFLKELTDSECDATLLLTKDRYTIKIEQYINTNMVFAIKKVAEKINSIEKSNLKEVGSKKKSEILANIKEVGREIEEIKELIDNVYNNANDYSINMNIQLRTMLSKVEIRLNDIIKEINKNRSITSDTDISLYEVKKAEKSLEKELEKILLKEAGYQEKSVGENKNNLNNEVTDIQGKDNNNIKSKESNKNNRRKKKGNEDGIGL